MDLINLCPLAPLAPLSPLVTDSHGNLASASCTATVKAKQTTQTPEDDKPTEQPNDTSYLAIGLGVGIGLAALAIIAAAVSIIVKRRK